MSDDTTATGSVSQEILRERLAAKDRSHEAEKELLRQKVSALEKQAAELSGRFETINSERSTLLERVEVADRTAAFGSIGLNGEEQDSLRSAIVERWKSVPVEDGGDRPSLSDWLSADAYSDPLISLHLPTRDGDAPPQPETPMSSRPTAPTRQGLNATVRPTGAPVPARLSPTDLRAKLSKELTKATPTQRRELVAQYRAQYPD